MSERISDYDYTLPEDRIAQHPLSDRAASKLLHLSRSDGRVFHRAFRDVPDLLQPGDLLVVNDTFVSALRLFGQKRTGGQAEVLLLREHGPGLFDALLRPQKRLPVGTEIHFDDGLVGTVAPGESEDSRRVQFPVEGLDERLAKVGRVPLPPYIHEELDDPGRYQTVYGTQKGSAAAPTAGLHFTPEIMDAVRARGVEIARVTLHVGLDTFRPVNVDDPALHPMHGEECHVPPETSDAIARCPGRVIAVGTTTVRTLESFAAGPRHVVSGTQVSRLFIRPGFEFRAIDGMFTNFHMPRTTMLMMISALARREWIMAAYEEALGNEYRFLSFGDSMLIL